MTLHILHFSQLPSTHLWCQDRRDLIASLLMAAEAGASCEVLQSLSMQYLSEEERALLHRSTPLSSRIDRDALSRHLEKHSPFASGEKPSELINSLPAILILAETQTEGVGRRGSSWLSPEGGLYMTLCIDSQVITRENLSTLCGEITSKKESVAALNKPEMLRHHLSPQKIACDALLLLAAAVISSLQRSTPRIHGQIYLKWPNDIYTERGKLAGVMAQNFLGEVLSEVAGHYKPLPNNPSAIPLTQGRKQRHFLALSLGLNIAPLPEVTRCDAKDATIPHKASVQDTYAPGAHYGHTLFREKPSNHQVECCDVHSPSHPFSWDHLSHYVSSYISPGAEPQRERQPGAQILDMSARRKIDEDPLKNCGSNYPGCIHSEMAKSTSIHPRDLATSVALEWIKNLAQITQTEARGEGEKDRLRSGLLIPEKFWSCKHYRESLGIHIDVSPPFRFPGLYSWKEEYREGETAQKVRESRSRKTCKDFCDNFSPNPAPEQNSEQDRAPTREQTLPRQAITPVDQHQKERTCSINYLPCEGTLVGMDPYGRLLMLIKQDHERDHERFKDRPKSLSTRSSTSSSTRLSSCEKISDVQSDTTSLLSTSHRLIGPSHRLIEPKRIKTPEKVAHEKMEPARYDIRVAAMQSKRKADEKVSPSIVDQSKLDDCDGFDFDGLEGSTCDCLHLDCFNLDEATLNHAILDHAILNQAILDGRVARLDPSKLHDLRRLN